ncbi:MAG: formimidoylglutamate deiminase [Polaromonas sp.]|nr:formimidoylglutamate deiminase [Polaromonas sp.]
MFDEPKRYFAPRAWVNGAWAKDVQLTVAIDGTWSSIQANASADQQPHAIRLAGPVLPGLVNTHSHAFQRAIAGMTERASQGAEGGNDNFWSWRDRMYSAAQRITPEQLEAVAAQLYAELLQAGYTQVCEFHYLHNDVNGKPYANTLDMSLALVRAAQRVGIGITLLPTLYMRSGFAATGLRDDQQRFASTPESIFRLCEGIECQLGGGRVKTGLALHSLRAVGLGALMEASAYAKARNMPIHIHVAEQTDEVANCMSAYGQRPVEWLLDHASLDARWNLVHATHTTPAELQGVKSSGAGIVLCPTTEANLGDGVFDLPTYAKLQGNWSIGSDSHVTRCWQEELRLLEYSQRFALRQRNVTASASDQSSTATALFNAALAGGTAACGLPMGGLAVGNRADFIVVDTASPALLGVPHDYLLDAMIFSSPDAQMCEAYVAGKPVVQAGRVANWRDLAGDFAKAMHALWA